MAIDPDRLKRAWKIELPDRWILGLTKNNNLSEDAFDVIDRVSSGKLHMLVNNLQSTIQALLPQTSTAFEAGHARVAWRDEMRLLVQEAVQLAVWPTGLRESEIQAVIDRLAQEGIESVIQRLSNISIPSADESAPVRLVKLCAIPLPQLSQLACDVAELSRFFTELARLIDRQTRSAELEQALAQREELIRSLEWER